MAADDIILGYAKIWTAPTGTAFPAPSIGYGVAWGGAWTYFGDTLTPLAFGGDRAVYDVMIQQSTASQKSIVTKDEHNFKTVMARHDVNMFNLLLLGTLTNTAPGSGTPGYYSIVFGGAQSPTRLAVGFEALYQTDAGVKTAIRWMFYLGSVLMDGDIVYDREKEAGIPINIKTYSDTTKAVGQQSGRFDLIYSPGT